jgi:uncharacterized metal-binding protein YceD (DUF177 family)
MTEAEPFPLVRPVEVASIRSDGSAIHVEANETERAGLAKLFGIPGIAQIKADFLVTKKGPRARVTGKIWGSFTQTCVLTLDPFDTAFRETVDLPFDEDPAKALELRPEEEAPDPIIDGIIDLGAITAEFTALALDPYPRKPGAVFDFKDKKDVEIAKPSAFGALATLKKPE